MRNVSQTADAVAGGGVLAVGFDKEWAALPRDTPPPQ
jgi:hypothetical protein